MAWKETNFEKLAKSLGANPAEVREKQKLVSLIIESRKEKGLSHAALAKKVGVAAELGFDLRISARRVAS